MEGRVFMSIFNRHSFMVEILTVLPTKVDFLVKDVMTDNVLGVVDYKSLLFECTEDSFIRENIGGENYLSKVGNEVLDKLKTFSSKVEELGFSEDEISEILSDVKFKNKTLS